ncbi:MAG: hypothetical protein HY814_13875 [Candidatus Riflebacteria bacterium]|nr:hypothetical protein [Candidatus Riflebacteria bacterium]
MVVPWLYIVPVGILLLALAGFLGFKRYYVTVGPDEYVVHYRDGKVCHIGRGLSFFCLPHDTYLKVPASLREINFVADQITKEKQGVRVQGFLAYKIANFEKAYQNLDLRSGIIRTLPKIEDNVKNKDFESKNRETVIKLDPSDPLAKTDEIIRRLAEAVVRHEVSNKTLNEMVMEREAVVQSMREQVMGTVREWGLSVDTIEFAEVWIRSKELFENLQAEYRNSVRLQAQNNTSETNKEIAAKQLESDKSIAMMTAAAEREKRVIASQEELKAGEIELANRRDLQEKEAQVQHQLELQQKENAHKARMAELANQRAVQEQQATIKLQLDLQDRENKHKAQVAEQSLAHEREIKVAQDTVEKQARQHEVMVDKVQKEEELRLAEARTQEALAQMAEKARIEAAELDRQREAIELAKVLDQKESEAKQGEIALRAEIQRVKELAAAQLAKAREEAQAIAELGRAEAEAARLKIEAQNAVNANQIHEQLIAQLPEIAKSMSVHDIHWVNMAASGDSPMGIVPRNILELLSILKGFGVDLPALAGRAANGAKSETEKPEAPAEAAQ